MGAAVQSTSQADYEGLLGTPQALLRQQLSMHNHVQCYFNNHCLQSVCLRQGADAAKVADLQVGFMNMLLHIHAAVHNAVIIQHLPACCPMLLVGLQGAKSFCQLP